jgi:hypothetical protein
MAINWKARAKRAEDDLAHMKVTCAHVAFNLEKEQALHRRTCEQNNALTARLDRAVMALCGAREGFDALGQTATAETLRLLAGDLRAPRAEAGVNLERG